MACVLLALLVACAGEEPTVPDLAARIGDLGLGYEEFEAYLTENSVDPDFGWGSDVLSALFDQYLDEELLRRLAVDRGLAEDDTARRSARGVGDADRQPLQAPGLPAEVGGYAQPADAECGPGAGGVLTHNDISCKCCA